MSARERILDAAAEVMATKGLVRTTTKEIARAAGLSEAMLYKHFADKQDLFVKVLTERTPRIDLPPIAGEGDLTENLVALAAATMAFYFRTFPIAASIFSAPELLVAHRTALASRGAGPRQPVNAVAGYLAAEQECGRITPGLDAEAMATLLMGACFMEAFQANYSGAAGIDETLPRRVVAVLMAGLTA